LARIGIISVRKRQNGRWVIMKIQMEVAHIAGDTGFAYAGTGNIVVRNVIL
jgi:hypothetical protein